MAPAIVKLVPSPGQMVVLPCVRLNVGNATKVMVLVIKVDEQTPDFPVTEYVVSVVGVTLITAFVAVGIERGLHK